MSGHFDAAEKRESAFTVQACLESDFYALGANFDLFISLIEQLLRKYAYVMM